MYNYILYDSYIEKKFAEKLEKDKEVKVYVKLPSWFEIDTPIGGYNPDWAILMEENDIKKLYFVVETKGSLEDDDLRKRERDKINCAKEHFKALESGIRYVVATDLDDIKE
ncbi:hypothetical protein ERM65_02070 [Clostridioides difficile]|nr:hypothetical protein [Clostridioides difficile]EGT4224996.1 hypothetical protein [Clostridioides difficile]